MPVPRRALPLLAAATTLVAAGCGWTSDDDAKAALGAAGVSPPGPGASLPAPDRLVIAVAQDVGPLNIVASHEEPLTELVYDKLLAPSPYVDAPKPRLASAVRMVDPSTWVAELRTDVTWHDGERFTADDVVCTVDYFKKAPTGRWTHHVSDVPHVDRVETISESSVRFHCAYPCPDLGPVTLADIPIIPQHVWSKVPPEEAKASTALPVGTGPDRLAEYTKPGGYRFEANAGYFAGKPRGAALDMPVISDPSTAFTALRSRQVDATTHHVPPELVDQLSHDDGIKVIKTSPLQFPELLMNFERAPFGEPRFRRALSRALDRDQLLATVFLGKARPATRGYPHPDAPFANPALSTPYDAAEARRLLDELKFTDTDGDGVREGPDGPLRFTIFAEGTRGVNVRAAEPVAEDLREVNIEARVEPRDAGFIGSLHQFTGGLRVAYGDGAAFSLTVRDCDAPVTLQTSPQPVVLLDASAAAYLDAVDASDGWYGPGTFPPTNFPADTHRKIMNVPELGSDQTSTGGVALSLETVIDAEPDLVIGYTTDTITREGLARADIPLYVVPSYCDSPGVPSFDSVYEELRFYGRAFDKTAAADAEINRMRPIVEGVTAAKDTRGRKASALYVSSDASAVYTYSELAMVRAHMEALGLRNVFADPDERSPEISYEELIAAAPDVLILLYTDTRKTPEEITKLVTGRAGTDAIPAVANGDVFPLLLNFSERYSPITVDGLQKLQKILAG